MLSFHVDNSGRTIHITCDALGMKTLIDAMEKLHRSGGHIHLATPSCGGKELDEQTAWNEAAIGEVIITWAGE